MRELRDLAQLLQFQLPQRVLQAPICYGALTASAAPLARRRLPLILSKHPPHHDARPEQGDTLRHGGEDVDKVVGHGFDRVVAEVCEFPTTLASRAACASIVFGIGPMSARSFSRRRISASSFSACSVKARLLVATVSAASASRSSFSRSRHRSAGLPRWLHSASFCSAANPQPSGRRQRPQR